MKYLKKFNENLTTELTIKMINDLRIFSRNYLSYLIDDGFFVQVTPSFKSSECQIIIHKDYDYFSWKSIKDSIIPFLYMLNKSYNIIGIYDSNQNDISLDTNVVSTITGKLSNILEDSIDGDIRMSTIGIVVNFKEKVVKEAKEEVCIRNFSNESFKEFCDGYLAYLYDDGFVAFYTTQNILFKKNILILRKEEESGNGSGIIDVIPFYWYKISEKFVPFFKMLNKYYLIGRICVLTKDSIYNSPFGRKDKELIFSCDERDRTLPLIEFIDIMTKYHSHRTIEEITIEVQNLEEL